VQGTQTRNNNEDDAAPGRNREGVLELNQKRRVSERIIVTTSGKRGGKYSAAGSWPSNKRTSVYDDQRKGGEGGGFRGF